MRAKQLVAFLVAAALAAACGGNVPGNPNQPPPPATDGPMGVPLPNQPFRQNFSYEQQVLRESEESRNPGSETALWSKMGNLIRVGCGPSAPPGRVCVKLDGLKVRLDSTIPHKPDSAATVSAFVSPDCASTGASVGFLEFLHPQSSVPVEDWPSVSTETGVKVLDYEPCGMIIKGRYQRRDIPGEPGRFRWIMAETTIRLEKN